jgi:hypothetical protein
VELEVVCRYTTLVLLEALEGTNKEANEESKEASNKSTGTNEQVNEEAKEARDKESNEASDESSVEISSNESNESNKSDTSSYEAKEQYPTITWHDSDLVGQS